MNKKFRTVILGSGMIANSAHLPAIEYIGDSYDVVGVADIRESAARETAGRFGIDNYSTDCKKLLGELKPDIAIVCSPNASHKELSLLALEAGANVICEKPVAMKYADAVELFDSAEKKGLNFFPAQTMRFFPVRQAVKKIIDAGVLGSIYYAQFDSIRRRGIPRWGFFHMKDYNCSGPFGDLAVHEIDYILWALGNPRAVAVSGSAWSKIGNSGEELQTSPEQGGAFGGIQITPRPYDWKEFDVEDMSTGVIRLEGGLLVNFQAAWAVNFPEKWERRFAGDKAGIIYNNDLAPTIFGGSMGWQTDFVPHIFEEVKYPEHIVFPGHIGLLKNIAGYLRGQEELVIKKAETLNVTSIIEAFYRSAEEGREIECPHI